MAKKLAYVLATLIILAALLTSVARLLTPALDARRADIEKWASDLLEMPVTIQKVRLSWYQYQPEISLDEIAILSSDRQKSNLKIKRVMIFFSIPQSIWHRKPVPSSIMVLGSEVNVLQDANGKFSLQGFSASDKEMGWKDALGWLFTQPSLILNNIDVHYTGFSAPKRFVTFSKLSIENSDNHHTILAKAVLHQEVPTELIGAVKWTGEPTEDFAKIRAKIYLSISSLSLNQWLKGRVWNGWQVNAGVGSAEIWLAWDKGQLHKIQSIFKAYGLNLYSAADKSSHVINRLSGNVGWKQDGQTQVIAGQDVIVDLPSRLWPMTNFYISLLPNADGQYTPSTVNVSYMDLRDVQSFLLSSPFLTDAIKKTLIPLGLKGDLKNASVAFTDSSLDMSHISLRADFNHLSFAPQQKMPGLDNVSGTMKWDGVKGDLAFNTDQAVFKYDAIFTKPLMIEKLTGDVSLQRDDNKNFIFSSTGLHVENQDVSVNATGSLTVIDKKSPYINLTADVNVGNVKHIARYLPMQIFDPDLVKWLQQAFLSGEVTKGHVILKGPVNEYPFDHGEGQFLATANLKQVGLHYAPGWPDLSKIDGAVTFSGSQMVADVEQAEIMSISTGKVSGVITNLGQKTSMLAIKSNDVNADLSKGMAFVHASPLQATLGEAFRGMEVQGPMKLNLTLDIPLSHMDDLSVQGNISLDHAVLNLVPWNLVLKELNGSLSFTKKTTDAKEIQGLLFDKPVKIALTTIVKNKAEPVVRATLASRMKVDDLESWLKLPLSKVAKGEAAMNGQVDFAFDQPIKVNLTTDLVGVSLALPDAYAKQASIAKKFVADIIVQENKPMQARLTYGDQLSAALVLNRKNDVFNLIACDLSLGKAVAGFPTTSGLYISGAIDKLDWAKIGEYKNQSNDKTFANGLTLRGIDITVGLLDIFGQRINNVRLQLTPEEAVWNIGISSATVIGQIKAPVKMNANGQLTAQFQLLNLEASPKSSLDAPSIDVAALPTIVFSADKFIYNQMVIGKVSFRTSPLSSGLSISSLNVVTPQMNLQASGGWLQSKNRYSTHLQGDIKSSNVSRWLASLGFDVHNFISSNGRFDFNVDWADAPFAFSFAKLSGHASVDLGKGRIVELSQTSGAKMDLGRMLNIFSLQTIPRRLSLDFSDIFQSGYSFDSFRGNVTFSKGDLFTTNTKFDGPVARVDIAGRIGMREKDYDLTLSVMPYVTSSIPVAATFLASPVVGVAALAVNSVIGSQVSKAITYYYSVRGPWSNPTWEPIKVSEKNREQVR